MTGATNTILETDRTFLSDGGEYNYQYIFENYIAFVENSLYNSPGHINGSVVVGGEFKKSNLSPGQVVNLDGNGKFIYGIDFNDSINHNLPVGIMDAAPGYPYFLDRGANLYIKGTANINNIWTDVDAFLGREDNEILVDYPWNNVIRYSLNGHQ